MSLLVETIYIQAQKIRNLSFHQARFRKSRKALFDVKADILLKEVLAPTLPKDDVMYKCRVLYDEIIREITYKPYFYPVINSLAIMTADDIEYPYKWVERPELDEVFRQKGNADEIIIIRKGWVTDAYYYNLVFEKNGEFFTPHIPLLKGTQRASLIRKKKIIPMRMSEEDIFDFERVHLINAMTELGKMVVHIDQIFKR
ncbi:MAG: hypothetical protein IPN97_18235 [Saprospiraceae bacterium]|nr:hypothetical protein [Saprospiraceae bacterium]